MNDNEIIINTGYLLRGKDFDIVERAHIVIADDKIEAINRGWTSQAHYSFPNGVVVPGLVNAHVHTGDYSFQEAGLDLSFEELVASPSSLKHKLLKSLPKQRIANGIKNVLTYSIRTGVLVLADFREGGLEGVRIALEASKNTPLHYLIFARPSREGEDPRKLVENSYGIGLPTPLGYSKEYLKRLRRTLSEKKIATHVGELAEYAEKEYELATKVLEADFIVHGTHLGKKHFEELSASNRGLVLCPRANSWFGVGLPPLEEVFKYDLRIGLGTDNTGWIKPDLWRELEYTWNILRLKHIDIDPRRLLSIATHEAASILGLEDYGVIDEGYEASFIVLDSEGIGFKFSYNPIASIVKRGGGEHIIAVFFKGELVFSSSSPGKYQRRYGNNYYSNQ